jgi:hypothetical protein
MSEILELNRDDPNFKMKKDVLNNLISNGGLDDIKSRLRAKVIEQLEAEKKKYLHTCLITIYRSRGKAAKYAIGSEIT